MTALKDLLDALGNPNRTDDYKYVVLELIADKQNPKAIAPLISIFNDARTSSGLRNKIALCLTNLDCKDHIPEIANMLAESNCENGQIVLSIIDKYKDALAPEMASKAVATLNQHKSLLEAESKPTSDQKNALQLISKALGLLDATK